MHNISRKNLVAGAVIIFIGIGLFFSLNFYQTHKKNQRDLIQEKLNYESAVKALGKEKNDLTTAARDLGINYFSRFPESSQMDLSFFMFNRISTMANKWKVNLVSFSPAEKEIKGNYSLISFSGAINASFSDMVNFFQELEDKEKISIDNLKINTSSQASSTHQAEFDLVCLEFHDPMLKGREAKEKGSDISPSEKEKIKTVKRDPFLNPFEKMHVARPTKKNRVGTVDVASELNLTGINCSAISRVAIINHTMAKEGDLIGGKRVVAIKEDRVILKANGQISTLRLKETPRPQTKEQKPLKTEEVVK
jgi:hypothetical protein